MTRTIPWFLTVLISFFDLATVAAQDIPALLKQAGELERSFRDEEALQKYAEVLARDSSHITALCQASELYSVIGKRKEGKEKQQEFYSKGNYLARRALTLAPSNSEANFAMAVSLGRMALISSGQEKIRMVKDIKTYADRCVQLDPSNYKGYYLIGRWNYDVSNLNSVERWLVKITYGALPSSSLDAAIQNYRKSMALNPSFILNYYELARAYRRNNENEAAKKLLMTMETLPPVHTDDMKIKTLGRKMLSEL